MSTFRSAVVTKKEILQMLPFLEWFVLLPSLYMLILLFFSISVRSGGPLEYSPRSQRRIIDSNEFVKTDISTYLAIIILVSSPAKVDNFEARKDFGNVSHLR